MVHAQSAAGAADGLPADAGVLGKVTGAWGVRGWIRVAPFNDPRDSILLGQQRWWLRGHGGWRALEIDQARVHGDALVAKAAGLDDREQAQALKGCDVLVSRAAFPEASAGEVYWIDLIGCTVRNPAGETLGTVAAVEEFGAHPVLRVEADGADGVPGASRLIPFVPQVVRQIDLPGRAVLVDWELDY
jgi:16S rRNA processing protein RimM